MSLPCWSSMFFLVLLHQATFVLLVFVVGPSRLSRNRLGKRCRCCGRQSANIQRLYFLGLCTHARSTKLDPSTTNSTGGKGLGFYRYCFVVCRGYQSRSRTRRKNVLVQQRWNLFDRNRSGVGEPA